MRYILSFIVFIVFVGCGGGGSSSSVTSANTKTIGALIDSFVSGANYDCSSSGLTNSSGIFTCDASSIVDFTVGGVVLGSMTVGTSHNLFYVTPARLYGLAEDNIDDPRVLHFIQFIQSLDDDANVDNGINITQSIRDALLGSNLDISDPSTTIDDINSTLIAIGKSLVPKDQALDHYKKTLQSVLGVEFSPEPYQYQQWYIEHNTTFYNQNGIDSDAGIHADNFLGLYTGNGVKIAVIDDGLDIYHEDLSGAIIDTYDSATGGKDVSQNTQYDSHGTEVTGIVGSRVNLKGIHGIASKSQIIFIKYQSRMTDSEIIDLFDKADKFGADIISCSWGTGDVSDAVKSKIVDLANNGRGGKGTVIVFASGNKNKDMENDESAIPEVISVGSTDKYNERASYSNYGVNLDVMAPGGEYTGITTLDVSGADGINGSGYVLYDDPEYFIGTSASTPIVSGVVALMLEKNPNLTRVEVENILKNSSDKIGNISYVDGRNDYYGYGKINLTNIMSMVP